MLYNISYSCISHIGRRRSVNQDNFLCNGRYMKSGNDSTDLPLTGCVTVRTPSVFGVFDGMGGEECGEIASFIAAMTASEMTVGKNAADELSDFCYKANDAICCYAAENSISSMGTTAAMLVFAPKEIVLCNIGDSKVFRFSGGGLKQISYDHVIASSGGTKPPLFQNLGIPPSEMRIEPYLARGEYGVGDMYLICSDGLTDMMTTSDIENLLKDDPSITAAEKMLQTALDNGGKDNITVILCKVERAQNNVFSFFSKDNGGKIQ